MADNLSGELGFQKLYQEHHAWLVRWLTRRTRNVTNAQDLAQDTFLRLLDRTTLPENLYSPRAWLARIADNLVIDQARREVLERNYLELLAGLPEPEQPSPEAQMELLELLDQIDRLLNGLRPVEKTAFLMSRLDGLTYPEIAKQLNISCSSVEKYMAKAMLKCYSAAYPELSDS